MRHVLATSIFALSLLACVDTATSVDPLDEELDSGVVAGKLTVTEQACMLGVVNDCARSIYFFDEKLAWDSRSAAALMAARSGPDATCGTEDDAPLVTVEAVDALPYVGDAALGRLLSFTATTGCTHTDVVAVVETVSFSAAQAQSTLAAVNLAPEVELAAGAKLSAKTAAAIVAARPFPTDDVPKGLARLGAVTSVGPATLQRIRDFSETFAPDIDACGVETEETSGVAFSASQVHDALDIVNNGTVGDLTRIKGIGPTLAGRLTLARDVAPLVTMAAVDAVTGVGKAVLMALRDQVGSAWCAKPEAQCGCTGGVDTPALALEQAKGFLDDPSGPPSARFFALLGPDGYQRLADVLMSELAVDFAINPPKKSDPDALNAIALAALTSRLDQDRFARPFGVIEPAAPIAGDLAAARQVAVDALIVELGQRHFETTELGMTFEALIAGEYEAAYLEDIVGWRDASCDHLDLVEAPESWTFVGGIFGLLTEIRVSRATGQVESVFIEID